MEAAPKAGAELGAWIRDRGAWSENRIWGAQKRVGWFGLSIPQPHNMVGVLLYGKANLLKRSQCDNSREQP